MLGERKRVWYLRSSQRFGATAIEENYLYGIFIHVMIYLLTLKMLPTQKTYHAQESL